MNAQKLFHNKFEEKTILALEEISQEKVIVLKRQFEENAQWTQCGLLEAFDDILYSARWGCDDYVEESEVLDEFKYKCGNSTDELKTERFAYRFINLKKIEADQALIKSAKALFSTDKTENTQENCEEKELSFY